MPRFIASYTAYAHFIIPKSINIYLLDRRDTKNDGENVGSWWIKWGTFHYIDKEGKQQTIEDDAEDVIDWKHPSNIEIEDDDDDEEDCDDCGYTHHYEDNCPIGEEQGKKYEKWRKDEERKEKEEVAKINAPFVMGDPDEDLVNFMHDGAELFMGVKTGAIYINKPDGDIRIGTAGQGKFCDVKIPA